MGRRNRRNIYHYNGPEEDKKELDNIGCITWIIILLICGALGGSCNSNGKKARAEEIIPLNQQIK